jgi:hypothetical protein
MLAPGQTTPLRERPPRALARSTATISHATTGNGAEGATAPETLRQKDRKREENSGKQTIARLMICAPVSPKR